MPNNKITWISAQPLIGGCAIGAEKSLGKPEAIITGFAGNDNQYINYTNVQRKLDVPIITMTADYKKKLDGIDIPKVDLWVMVPICSGMSMANTSKNADTKAGNPDNCQNQNMYNMLDLALRNEAKAIMFENAPAIAQNMGEGVRNRLHEIAKSYGYSMQVLYTSTIAHGIPQDRKRTFCVFFRDGKAKKFFFETVKPKDIAEYLNEIPNEAKYQDILFGDFTNDPWLLALKEYYKMPDFSSLFKHLYDNFEHKMWTALNICRKIGLDKFDQWLAGNRLFERAKIKNSVFDMTWFFYFGGKINALIFKSITNTVHPDYTKARSLNQRECIHLMGMPHDFEVSDGFNPNMICQNVPVTTANYIVRNCIAALNGELQDVDSMGKIYLQDNLKHKEKFV